MREQDLMTQEEQLARIAAALESIEGQIKRIIPHDRLNPPQVVLLYPAGIQENPGVKS